MNNLFFKFFLNFSYKYLGNFIYIFKKRKTQTFKKNDLLVFNRTDRIGDAILSLPFFLSLKEKQINFIVLTSKYNDWVLKPFIKTKILTNFNLDESSGKILCLLRRYLSIINFKKNKIDSKKFYIDLKGEYDLPKDFNDYYKIHLKNWYLNLKFSNYIINDTYTYLSKKNLIDKYVDLIEEVFKIKLNVEELPNLLLNKIKEIKTLNLKKYISKNYILILCSNKEFKNFTIDNWIFFLNNINYTGKILIVDDFKKEIIKQLKRKMIYLKNKDKLIFVEEEFDLWELSNLSYNSKYLIGLDGGAFNFLQFFTNSIEFIFYSNPLVWRSFSLNKYVKIYCKDFLCIEKSIQKNKNKKLIIYNKKFSDSPYYEFYKVKNEIYSKKYLKEISNIINKELSNL